MPVAYSVSGSPEKGGPGVNQGSDNRHANTGNQVGLHVVKIESCKYETCYLYPGVTV